MLKLNFIVIILVMTLLIVNVLIFAINLFLREDIKRVQQPCYGRQSQKDIELDRRLLTRDVEDQYRPFLSIYPKSGQK
ncbi:MAG: hypothetical protein GY858_09205 [Candidatus Omnitrophica bacterium]|nr:hypothetical protein [Candidatus Omnitrophota bacterium]